MWKHLNNFEVWRKANSSSDEDEGELCLTNLFELMENSSSAPLEQSSAAAMQLSEDEDLEDIIIRVRKLQERGNQQREKLNRLLPTQSEPTWEPFEGPMAVKLTEDMDIKVVHKLYEKLEQLVQTLQKNQPLSESDSICLKHAESEGEKAREILINWALHNITDTVIVPENCTATDYELADFLITKANNRTSKALIAQKDKQIEEIEACLEQLKQINAELDAATERLELKSKASEEKILLRNRKLKELEDKEEELLLNERRNKEEMFELMRQIREIEMQTEKTRAAVALQNRQPKRRLLTKPLLVRITLAEQMKRKNKVKNNKKEVPKKTTAI